MALNVVAADSIGTNPAASLAAPTTTQTIPAVSDDRSILWVEIGATATVVTLVVPGVDRFGIARPDVVTASLTSTKRAFRLVPEMVDPATGLITINFSQVTSVLAVVLTG
jgi:hypothetical protein